MSVFDSAEHAARYAGGPARLAPGLRDMHRMARLLIAETIGDRGEILVLGAGGGLEIADMATAQPGWRFHGVDPAAAMLDAAAKTTAAHSDRVTLQQGYAQDAPEGPFDAATCLLTLHFVPEDQKLTTLQALRQRLRPGAPLITAQHSIPRAGRTLWLSRYAAFAADSGLDPERARAGAAKIAAELPILSPEEDEALLAAAGFRDIALFWAGLTFRGWIARA